ncbi:MAG: DUF4450 domain-containing protein [Bacteroidales bacterium]|nr:DUF4450 domain-containing protein [Bacteroidales bacterium]MCM1146835.1 DUF4450 domain-containing protein [Bacteroidales bacterium]MCM1205667.1 DUF4450 domain-containing protein [Bacillota bacterium]MCM1510221.1 DUF4450 domain-containing protein [Clostridium sp.]
MIPDNDSMSATHTFRVFKALALGLFLLLSLPISARQRFTADDISGATAERSMQYYPEGKDFVCVNGKNRFTRPLYGTHTAWRLETSDRPVFAVYNKPKSRHVAFSVVAGGKTIALDSTAYCKSRYAPGRRDYTLKDRRWGGGTLSVTAIPLADKEGAVWMFRTDKVKMRLRSKTCPIRAVKLQRSGDLGVDRADSFEPSLTAVPECAEYGLLGKELYIVYEDNALRQVSVAEGRELFAEAEQARKALVSRLEIVTPDPYINTLGGALMAAADGIWDGEVWLHGANAWRMPLSGWRAAYAGDFLGWHDRARRHFDNYANSQVTGCEPVYPHPAQDAKMNNARAEKKWGTPMYSNGYICRNPNRNDQMHHYDMNLCYINELLWHLCWTGDTAYARKMWNVLTCHLEWEKRNFDPDGDGLYDAYCCIWASDALYYNSGAVTHSSAYNYRANRMAARIAALIGEDGSRYAREAERIKEALDSRLWMEDKGCWAEYEDYMGSRSLHASPALWTIYHAIDSDVGDMFQYYRATKYVDREIPHIPVTGKGIEGSCHTVSTTNWMPYAWSINNVAFAEVWHTALAFWQAGRNEEAFRLFKSSVIDGMYLGRCPGNFGQISHYDRARGECYRDFGDPIGVAARALVQGLFGVAPDLLDNKVSITPGFPAAWNHASLHSPDIDIEFKRKGTADTYIIRPRFMKPADVVLTIPALLDSYGAVQVNGRPVTPVNDVSVGRARIVVECRYAKEIKVVVKWSGSPVDYEHCRPSETKGSFARMRQGKVEWWSLVEPSPYVGDGEKDYGTVLPEPDAADSFRMVSLDSLVNASVTDIFRNTYASPRSPYTTLQIPLQGIGEWCHPRDTAYIDDSGFRREITDGVFSMPQGVPFRSYKEGRNIVFTSLWDNYPDSVSVALEGCGKGIYLLLAGSTNHMQSRHRNGLVTIEYADGTTRRLELRNPDNWAPIEQDFYIDGKAFSIETPRPYRVALASGIVSNDMDKALGLKGLSSRTIPGGAATVLYVPLQKGKPLKGLKLKTTANDVVIGLMAATIAE